MGASPSKGGGCWKGEIYFDPESDKTTGESHNITDNELREKLGTLIKTSEEILHIRIYSNKLHDLQLTSQVLLVFHAFIVLETNDWWWSIEKNEEGITIQRSKKIEYVRDKYRQHPRKKPILKRIEDNGRKKMEDLVNWLYQKDELNRKYSWDKQEANCQGFANGIFDEFAKTKTCNCLFLPV